MSQEIQPSQPPFSPRLSWSVQTAELVPNAHRSGIELGKAYLPYISSSHLKLVSEGTAESLSEAVRESPLMIPFYRRTRMDRLPKDLAATDRWLHIINPSGNQVICVVLVSPQRDRFLRVLSDHADSKELGLRSSLEKRIIEGIQRGHLLLLPVYGDAAVAARCSRADIQSGLENRGYPGKHRIYSFDPKSGETERTQYENHPEFSLPSEQLSAKQLVRCVLSPLLSKTSVQPVVQDVSQVTHLSIYQQAELYRQLFSDRAYILREGSPIPIPKSVEFESSEELSTVLFEGHKPTKNDGYYKVEWNWTIGKVGPYFVDGLVRFHTKVSESDGDMGPSFVVNFRIRDNSSVRGNYVLLNNVRESDEVQRLIQSGLEVIELNSGACLIPNIAKESTHTKFSQTAQSIEILKRLGKTSEAEELEKSRLRAKYIGALTHFPYFPELDPRNVALNAEFKQLLPRIIGLNALALRTSDAQPGREQRREFILTLKEFAAHSPSLAGLNLRSTAINIQRKGGQFFVSHEFDSKRRMYAIDTEGRIASAEEISETLTGMQVRALDLEQFHDFRSSSLEILMLDARNAALKDFFCSQLPGYQAFTVPDQSVETDVDPRSIISVFSLLHMTTERGFQASGTAGIEKNLETHSVVGGLKSSYRIGYDSNSQQPYIARHTNIPGSDFFSSCYMNEVVRLDLISRRILSTECYVYGRSSILQLLRPSENRVQRYLNYIAAHIP